MCTINTQTTRIKYSEIPTMRKICIRVCVYHLTGWWPSIACTSKTSFRLVWIFCLFCLMLVQLRLSYRKTLAVLVHQHKKWRTTNTHNTVHDRMHNVRGEIPIKIARLRADWYCLEIFRNANGLAKFNHFFILRWNFSHTHTRTHTHTHTWANATITVGDDAQSLCARWCVGENARPNHTVRSRWNMDWGGFFLFALCYSVM